MAALLRLGKEFVAYHEPDPSLYGLSKAVYATAPSPKSNLIAREAFLLARRQLVVNAVSREKGYIETSPQVTFLAPIIDAVLPNSLFVHLIRNPYDVVRSGMRRGWYSGNPADSTRIVPDVDSEFGMRWTNMSALEKNLWLWRETNDWVDGFLLNVSTDRKLRLKYEHCFCANSSALPDLFSAIGCSRPQSSRIRRVLSKKLNAQEGGDFPRVEDWTSEMKNSAVEIAGPTIERFGYDIVR